MMNKKFIKVECTDYGYDIYAINGNKVVKLGKRQKVMMHRIVRKFRCVKLDNNTFIYPNYNLITLTFMREKLRSNPPKVNRRKSIQIISSVLVVPAMLAVLAEGVKDMNKDSINLDVPTTPSSDIIDENYDTNRGDQFVAGDQIFIDNITPDNDIIPEPTESPVEMDNINQFYYEFAKPNDKAALNNAQNYMDVFLKYEKMYGVDAKLLCAIGAQESSGVHHEKSINGGYATGLMGIENIWANADLRVFNFETNSYETIKVDYSKIGQLDYNIKIGAAIFQNYFYSTIRNASDSISDSDYLAFTLQKYNMGPGNMGKVLKCGNNWIDNRDVVKGGDKYYFEHVLSRLDNDTVINIRLSNGEFHSTEVANTAFMQHYRK